MSPNFQMVAALVAAGLPTLTVLVSILINNSRLSDMQRYMVDMQRYMDKRFDEQRELFRADLFRVEQVIDARLKHLEEHR